MPRAPEAVARPGRVWDDNEAMRMFVAARPPEPVIEALSDFLAPRREVADSGWRWTVEEQWHLTLAFYARVPERALDDLEERLGRAASRRAALSLTVTSVGAFPHIGQARVLYFGVDARGVGAAERERAELGLLAAGARAAAVKAGIEVAGSRFRPHLTLARRGRPVEATRWVRALDGFISPPWPLRAVTLVQSHLGEGPRGRPRYVPIATFPLGQGSR